MAELRSMRSSAETETVGVTEVVGATVMVLTPEEWLFEVILDLTGAAPAAATI